jgi:hypothetical protein
MIRSSSFVISILSLPQNRMNNVMKNFGCVWSATVNLLGETETHFW